MEKDSTCPAGRKQPQELGSEPGPGSPAPCWSLGAKCQDTARPSQGWTRALRTKKRVPTSGAALGVPATCASLNPTHAHLRASFAWWETVRVLSSNPGPDMNAHAGICKLSRPL